MSSINNFRNYKHDIVGKFKDISTAIESMDENSFSDPECAEVFHAIHEVLVKMVTASRKTIFENLKDLILVVSDEEPDQNMPRLQIEGINLRFETINTRSFFHYSIKENNQNIFISIGKIYTYLPIKKVISQSKNDIINDTVKHWV